MREDEACPKDQHLATRARAAMAHQLAELRELAPTEPAKPSQTDALRAMIRAGAPVVRAKPLASIAPELHPLRTRVALLNRAALRLRGRNEDRPDKPT